MEVESQSLAGCCVGDTFDSESVHEASSKRCNCKRSSPYADVEVMEASENCVQTVTRMDVKLDSTFSKSFTSEALCNEELNVRVEAQMNDITLENTRNGTEREDTANLASFESNNEACCNQSMNEKCAESISKYDGASGLEEHCIRNLPEEASDDAGGGMKDSSRLQSFPSSKMAGTSDNEVLCSSNELKNPMNSLCLDFPNEVDVRDGSNDDMQSEVSNPPDMLGCDHGACGEITSACSPSNFVDDNLIDVEQTESKDEASSTTCVVIEIPKHIRPTGIRKITFKFNKRKDDYDRELSVPVEPLTDEKYYRDLYGKQFMPSNENLTMYDSGNLEWEIPEMDSRELKEFYDPQSPFSSLSNMDLKMPKKVVMDDRPASVTDLLSTRILEGARVNYISDTGESKLPGFVKDCGYLCGCGACNFSKVVSAHEFELHAGTQTTHPNDHIYLENGKPISSIIHELRAAPLSSVGGIIKSIAGSSLNEEYFQLWRDNVLNYKASAYITHQNYTSPWHYPHPGLTNPQSYVDVPVERKRLTKKQRHNLSSSFSGRKKPAENRSRKRDNDLHKLLFMPDGLPDGTSLAYYSKGKDSRGYKQGGGILCNCCNKEISPSQFEAHAGWAAKRQPYRHIYTSSGLTLHDIAMMLASGQSLTSTGSDDMCTMCGGGGELIICNGCPRSFHAACLGLEIPPSDDWHCSHCSDKSTSSWKATGESRPFVIRLKRVVKAPEFEPGGCIICRSQDFSAADFDDRTVIICDQCEKEYHVGCLRESGICDLKELPEDKWFCSDVCDNIYGTLQTMSSSGPVDIPASVLAALNKKQAAMGLITGSRNEIQWSILSGKSRSPEHLLLLTRAASIFRERFDPIIAKSGRDLIPVMVYGRNISGQEFSGMYCVVLIANSFVVSAALLRIFGPDVAELPLVATTRDNQGKGYFQAIFSCIEGLLSAMKVKHLVLPAAAEAQAMWVNKLGFQKTSHEQMLKYTRDYQLTIFKGTSLLEKEIQDA